ncbi:hypothetical protein [Tenuibacillus multivorans]|uniref:hypothetical protein n=1 Tax=Tenuibacillus multivorans TaxID=237069 RepID=UPI000B8615AF|nr:hypothetical protein [Tenuibacillus multivorans]
MLKWIPSFLILVSFISLIVLMTTFKTIWLFITVPSLFFVTAIWAFIYRKSNINQLIFYIAIGVLAGMIAFSLM